MRKCWKCVSVIPDTSRFCEVCGSDLKYGFLAEVGVYNIVTPVEVGGILFYREHLAMPDPNQDVVLAAAVRHGWGSDVESGVRYMLLGYTRNNVVGVAVLPTVWMEITKDGSVVKTKMPDVILLLPPGWAKHGEEQEVITGYGVFMKIGERYVLLRKETKPTPEQLVRYVEEEILSHTQLLDELYCGKFVRRGKGPVRILELRRIYRQARLGDPVRVDLKVENE